VIEVPEYEVHADVRIDPARPALARSKSKRP
jgi:hypothetical protein